jgi:hypothetical protein
MKKHLGMALLGTLALLGAPKDGVELWSQKPVVRPPVPSGVTQSKNPIDAFIATDLQKRKLVAAPPADKAVLLRRVCSRAGCNRTNSQRACSYRRQGW